MRKFSFIVFFLFLVEVCFAQTLTLTGRVFSADDSQPLPGVAVMVKGTLSGTSTDFDGVYSIKVKKGETLVFTSFGFADKELVVESEGTFDVYLETDSLVLEEVVAIGYGVVK